MTDYTNSAFGAHAINALAINSNVTVRLDEAVAAIRFAADANPDVQTPVLGEAVMGLLFSGEMTPTVNSSSEGVAAITVMPNGDLVVSSSSEGMAVLSVDAQGDLVVSGTSEGLAAIGFDLEGDMTPTQDIYLYSEGMAEIGISGTVARLARPGIPDAYYEAKVRFNIREDRSMSVEPGTVLEVPRSERDYDVRRRS